MPNPSPGVREAECLALCSKPTSEVSAASSRLGLQGTDRLGFSQNQLVGVSWASVSAALGAAIMDFGGGLDGLADWNEDAPSTLAFQHGDREFEYANGASFFDGTDPATQTKMGLNLSVTISGQDALGFAVYGPSDFASSPGATSSRTSC